MFIPRSCFPLLIATLFCFGCTDAPLPDSAYEGVKIEPKIDSVTEVEDLSEAQETPQEYNELNDFEKHVILGKGTERRFVGEYTDLEDAGTYVCRRCNAPLYKSEHKFHSGCGWPAIDDEIPGDVRAIARRRWQPHGNPVQQL